MQKYAEKFYKSKAWQQCRDAYARSKGGLCEICLKQGRYVPGEIVHHKIHLSPETIKDPKISLSWENLQLVCRECHAKEHDRRQRRYRIDQFGRLIL